MSAASTYREIQDRVLSVISKSDTTTRNRVKTSINLGYQDFVLRELWPFRETTGTLNTVASTQEYSLSSNFSDIDANNITGVTLQGTPNSKLIYWPYQQLRADAPDFDLEGTSVPTRYYLKGGSIGFWPTPADAYAVAIDYYKTPTEMSADSDTPIIPVAYREALVHYALSDEHDFNSDPDLAQKAMNRYEQILTLARNNLLAQPSDTEAFKIMGPADSKYWGGLSSEIR